MQKLLIATGLLITAVGIAWPWLARLPFGKLPGDIALDRPGFKFFLPLTTMLIVSVVLSLILWLLRK